MKETHPDIEATFGWDARLVHLAIAQCGLTHVRVGDHEGCTLAGLRKMPRAVMRRTLGRDLGR